MTVSFLDQRRSVADVWRRLEPEHSIRQMRLAVAAGRLTLVFLSVMWAYAAGRELGGQDAAVLLLLTATWLVTLRFGNAVSPDPLGPVVATAAGGTIGFVVVSAMAHVLPLVHLSTLRLLSMTVSIVFFVGLWECIVHRTTATRRRVLVVGTPVAADELAHEIEQAAAHIDLLGLVRDGGEPGADCAVPILGQLEGLPTVIDSLQPDLVVLGDDSGCAPAVERLLDAPCPGFRVVGLTSFFECALGRVPISKLSAAWFMSLLHLRRRGYSRWSKRVFDVLAAAMALVVAAPVIALVSLALLPYGPVLYRQTRLGERGRRFTILKFRTMVDRAEGEDGAVWSVDGDPRVTRLGRVLRRTHVDELPQLVNVLRGDMSMVGPRPERPEFVAQLEENVPFWHRRLLVKPGVTGWAQLKGGYASDLDAMADKLSYDLWYLRNSNVVVDVAICIATATMMLCQLVSRPCRKVVG